MKFKIILLSCLVSFACKSPGIVTTWKVQKASPLQYDKVMVVGIIKSKDDSLRMYIENRFVKAIQDLNYYAVPSSEEFSPGDLTGSDQTNTYIKLCNNGIDAVVTITLIDGTKEAYQTPGNIYEYPASYYYNRIWNYKNLQADLYKDNIKKNNPDFWEIILFDLNTLEAACVVQTKSFLEIKENKIADDFANQVIRKMLSEKILARKKNPLKSPRPF